jgi:hypothetical protein
MATFQRKQNLTVATALLAVVESIISEDDQKGWWLECYSNGREQGYCLHSYRRQISFSENRNSDDIVVYVGYMFNMQGNGPTDEAYKNRRLFNYNDYYKAAGYIVEAMQDANQEWAAIVAKQEKVAV